MQREERVLKIAAVQNGVITSEALLRDAHQFTVGTGYNVDFHVSGEGLPRKGILFLRKGPRYAFFIFPGSYGKIVTIEGRVYSLDQMVNSEYSRIEKGAPVVYLDRIERGKIVVGDTIFLFKYVELAPPPKLDLPAPKKEWTYLAILFASLIIHVSVMYGLSVARVKTGPSTIQAIPTRFAKLIVEKIPEKPKPKKMKNVPVGGKVKKASTGQKKEKASKPTETGGNATRQARAARPSKAALRKRVRSVGVLAVLTSKGGAGAVADVIGTGATLTGDLDKVLSEVGGVGVAKSRSEVLAAAKRRRGAAGGASADIGALSVGPGEKIGLGRKKMVRVRSRILTGAFSSSGSLDSRVIARFVKLGMGGIKFCYEMGLKRNPKLAGKVVVEFVIGTSGRVSTARVTFSSLGDRGVESCIVRSVLRLRFPPPKNGSVKVSYPFIFTSAG